MQNYRAGSMSGAGDREWLRSLLPGVGRNAKCKVAGATNGWGWSGVELVTGGVEPGQNPVTEHRVLCFPCTHACMYPKNYTMACRDNLPQKTRR